ncbi:sugar-binding transcriptional regulator [Aerococcus vaginalis]
MNADFENLTTIVPELSAAYQRRMKVLQTVIRYGPIGRKLLAEMLEVTERPLRKDIDLLKKQGLISVTVNGMTITESGRQLVAELVLFDSGSQMTNHRLEQACRQRFDHSEFYVISSDASDAVGIWSQMGIAVSRYMDRMLDAGHCTIAVAGGTTLSQMVSKISGDLLRQNRTFDVVAARGGLPETTDIQANTITERLADCLNGQAHVLYSPEMMSEESVKVLEREPAIGETLQLLKRSDVVLYGVGDAHQMASRRHLSTSVIEEITQQNAVGEVFGSFFDKQGNILYSIPRIGMHLEDLQSVALPILVAVGQEKADALAAYLRLAPPQSVIFIDETCAQSVLNGETHLK